MQPQGHVQVGPALFLIHSVGVSVRQLIISVSNNIIGFLATTLVRL